MAYFKNLCCYLPTQMKGNHIQDIRSLETGKLGVWKRTVDLVVV
jgi:hypothetical protein